LEFYAALVEHAPAHLLAQLLDVGSGGGAGVDQEIGVLLRDLRAADLQAAAAGSIDQLPRLVAGRIGEGRAAGAAARLGVGAAGVDLADAARDRSWSPGAARSRAEVKIQSAGASLCR
jgi:hypothetical protein